MKRIIYLLVVLALANASLTSKYQLQYGGQRSIMNVMMEVENKLKAGGVAETVNGVLNGFKNAVGQEQSQHDEVFGLQKAECDSEIAYRSTEVEDASNALRVANNIIKVATRLSQKTEATLAAVGDILTQTRQHLGIINDVRKEDTQSYNRAAVSFNDAINDLDDSLDLVGHASFVQIAAHSTKLLKHAIALKKTQEFAPVLKALAQLNQEESDEGALERLGQLVATLKANIQAAWTAYGEENQVALAQFNAQKERFNASVTRLEGIETRLTNKLEHLSGVISVQTAVQQANLNKRQRNQTLLDDANTLCGSFEVEYQSTTAGRRAELVLVAELERVIDQRLNVGTSLNWANG